MRSAAPLACRALLQIALLLLPVGRGAAQLPALDFTGTVRPFQLDRMTGLEFSVARPVTVMELGRFDINGNGILDDPGGA